jgi:hypothetical protein
MAFAEITKIWEQGGEMLTAEVSPCSWTHSQCGLQVKITKSGGGTIIRRNRAVTWDKATQDDFDALCGPVELVACCRKGCKNSVIADPEKTSNREGRCETCFLAKCQAEFDQESAKERDTAARRDRRMKAKGMTHRVTAWVHPARGDDRQIDFYCQGLPDAALIRGELKKLRSRVLDDYQVIAL